MNKKEQIEQLISEGKTYKQITEIMQISRSTVVYYRCNQKEKSRVRVAKCRSKKHPYDIKIEHFKEKIAKIVKTKKQICTQIKLIQCKIKNFRYNRITKEYETMSFNAEDVINKFGKNPKCYLTGKEIDIYQPRTYHFDHIIPVSKGGTNTLDNLGICTKEANMSKTDHTLDEFIKLCKDVLITQGYKVDHPDTASGLSDCKSNKDANPS